jgi:hypothetical protein
MACLTCKKNKAMKLSPTRINAISERTLYTNNDFVLALWNSEDNITFIGNTTQINYGIKFYGQRLLVHNNDLPDERLEVIN